MAVKVASLIPNEDKLIEGQFNVMLIGKHGTGKALPNYANVLTPEGWVTIGDIEVGQSVIGRDGKTYEVSGVFPQGQKDVVEMHFSDGTVIECCEDHLWTFHSRANRNTNKTITEPAVFFEDNIFSEPTEASKEGPNGQAKWYLPEVLALPFGEKNLFIEPYAMGLLIGDGSFRQEHEVRFSTADRELVPVVEKALGTSARYDGNYDYGFSGIYDTIIPELKDSGLHKNYSHEKHIPREYLFASIEQRLALLQGLLDSDGSPSGSGAEFTTTSEQLANDMKHLVHSLGGVSTLKSRTTKYTRNDIKVEGRQSYRLYIRLNMPLFRLERKQRLVRPYKAARRRLVGFVKTDRLEEMTCISVTSPDSLFITDGFTPTHNTESVRALAERHGLTVKSFSCATLDPYTDFVGVPVPAKDENGRDILKMVRPRDIDEADILFFDELNRARPEIQNAVLEIINNRTINGEPLPNLKGCWAAINPADADYKVDDLDPALWDRFDVYIEIKPKPTVAYMETVMPKPLAQALKSWYDDHNKGKRSDYISPRRLVKLGLVYNVTKDKRALNQAFPPGGNFDSAKLFTLLDEAMHPEKKEKRIKAQKAVEKEFDQNFPVKTAKDIKANKDKVVTWLDKNPQALDGHRKVSKALSKGVGSVTMFKGGYVEVLEKLHPTILESYIAGQSAAKLSQIRSCFRALYTNEHSYAFGPTNGIKTDKKLAKSLPNLHSAINDATKDKSAKMPALPKR